MAEYFGGSTTMWMPDQLKSAITRPCRYEAGVNRTYEDLAAHYGAVVIPDRPALRPLPAARYVLAQQQQDAGSLESHRYIPSSINPDISSVDNPWPRSPPASSRERGSTPPPARPPSGSSASRT